VLKGPSKAEISARDLLAAGRATKSVGILIFDNVVAADVMGPAEVFSRVTIPADADRRRAYQVIMIGLSPDLCETESGIVIKPQLEMRRTPPLDTVIVPSSSGIHNPKLNNQLAHWLKSRVKATRRIAAIGTGVYPLAGTGLLDGRQVVAHWGFAEDLAWRFPRLRVNSVNLFTRDQSFYTCAGGAAAVDLALALVEEDYGRQISLKLARELLLPLKRSGGDEQYPEALKFQIQSSDRFADLPSWILSHLNEHLSVDTLAEKACMSRGNFTRLFYKTFGKSPWQFVTEARIAEARRRVLRPRTNLECIADSLGFKSADVFSKAFERHVGIPPRTYRAWHRSSARRIPAAA
jgi:transcriptional regulator GlxA family with amidase domain